MGRRIILVDSVATVGELKNRPVFALLEEVEVPAEAPDRDDDRREEQNERGYLEVLVLGVGVDDRDRGDGIAEGDHAKQEQPRAGQKERRSSEKVAAHQAHSCSSC